MYAGKAVPSMTPSITYAAVTPTTLSKGDIAFMDNVADPQSRGAGEALAAVGAKRRFLPAYSTYMNPIENAYSKIKSGQRKVAASTFEDLTKAAGRCIKAIAPADCVGYFINAGCRVSGGFRSRSKYLRVSRFPIEVLHYALYS